MSVWVSVIIPTFNRERLVGHTLDTLPKDDAIEVIVVDDGSTDETVEFIRQQYPYVRLMRQQNQGASNARNYGLGEAKGKYIVYLDSDDLLENTYFEKRIQYLENTRQASGVYGPYDYFNGNEGFDEAAVTFKYKYPFVEELPPADYHAIRYMGGQYFPQPTLMWRKDALWDLRGHNPSLLVNQDVDLLLRACAKGMRFGSMKDAGRALIRNHDLDDRVGALSTNEAKLRQILALRKKFMDIFNENGMASREMAENTAYFFFDLWKLYRVDKPHMAEMFLRYSQQLHPRLQLRGGVAIRGLSALFGPVNATIIKKKIFGRD
jgi:glycosyltransferase involved in cell wall biosynthesis